MARPDSPPTNGSDKRFEDLEPQPAELLQGLGKVFGRDLAVFNELVESKGAPAIITGSTGFSNQ